jgi:hypothetical protein
VGQGGTVFHAAVAGEPGILDTTVIGAPWMLGTAAVGTVTVMGFAHGPASNATSTALPGGRISLVTPIFLSTGLSLGDPTFPLFARVTIDFVPEPSTLLLLSAGVAALAALGRRLPQPPH